MSDHAHTDNDILHFCMNNIPDIVARNWTKEVRDLRNKVFDLETRVAFAAKCFEDIRDCTTGGFKPNRLAKKGLEQMRDSGVAQ